MEYSELTGEIIGSAIEVHRVLGPGLLEGVYEEALCHEFDVRGILYKRQLRVPIRYKEVSLSTDLRLDLLVGDQIIVDIKAKETLSATDKPQLLTYLRLCGLQVGLIINFHVPILKQGVFRVVNGYAGAHVPFDDPPDLRAPVTIP